MKNNRSRVPLSLYLNTEDLISPTDGALIFQHHHPVEIEIGFGTGEYLTSIAQQKPQSLFIGFEQSATRIMTTLKKAHLLGLKNIRVLRLDAIWAFQYYVPESSIDFIHCLFPCPWPKKRHTKHRLFSKDFFALLATRLKVQGKIRIITDHEPYCQWMLEALHQGPFGVQHQKTPPLYATKFEKIWTQQGQTLFDELILTKISHPVLTRFQESVLNEMKIFSIDHIEPRKIKWPSYSEDVSVEFREYVFDEKQQKGYVQALVSEDKRTQYIGLVFFKNQKQAWTLKTMASNHVLPTAGVQTALDLTYQALQESAL